MSGRGNWMAGGLCLTVTLLLGGCGFHLRSYDVGTDLSSAYVVANARNPLEQPLRDALRQAGVTEADSAGDAEVVLELLDARRQRRNVSFSGQAEVAEYELDLGVRYRITDAEGTELVPEQWLERQRVYRVDADNIVGTSEEQALIEREMERDLVQSILRTLNTVVQQRGAAEAAAQEMVPTSEVTGAAPGA